MEPTQVNAIPNSEVYFLAEALLNVTCKPGRKKKCIGNQPKARRIVPRICLQFHSRIMGKPAARGSHKTITLTICRNHANKMTQEPYHPERLLVQLARRPLSNATATLAAILILIPLYQRSMGNVYLETFNYVDGTTLIMVGVLLLRGIILLRLESDLQAVAIALIGALSFVFAYEAIYKLSFLSSPGACRRQN
jgi:hypothetical protein